MKKSNFIALILGTAGMMSFALGMCMCLLPEWGMTGEGVDAGILGLAILCAAAGIRRKMEGKPPIRLNAKVIGSAAVGAVGALVFGAGMSMTLLFEQMALGIVVGIAGIMILLLLIPLAKGLK